jgi:hypothetical protein
MKQHTHQQETINYREPFGTSFRRRRREFTGVNYNDSSPEVAAMNAHLRASAYKDENRSSASTADYLDRGNGVVTIRPRAFPKLLREYNSQARDNFVTDAMLFTIIILAGLVWPAIHTVRALLQ